MKFFPVAALSGRKARPRFLVVASVCAVLAAPAAAHPSDGIVIQKSGSPPQLAFACCDKGIPQMRALFAKQEVVRALRDLHAQVAMAIVDFSPERAEEARFLNEQQIPVIAGLTQRPQDGFYFNADNAKDAPARVAAFERWTNENGLHWAAIGFDIEPNFGELASLRSHPWRLATTLLARSVNGRRMAQAKDTYSALIGGMQSQGYSVETYEMPYVPAERMVHTALLDRLLGTLNLPSNEHDWMVYTSYARPVGSAILLYLGPGAQGIALGVTDGPPPAGSGFGPLDWEEFSSDLLVASHFTRHVGVYDLEGCVEQGFLPRIEAMDWGKPVVIPSGSVVRARRHFMIFCAVLWIAAHLLYLLLAMLVFVVFCLWRWRFRRRIRRTLRGSESAV